MVCVGEGCGIGVAVTTVGAIVEIGVADATGVEVTADGDETPIAGVAVTWDGPAASAVVPNMLTPGIEMAAIIRPYTPMRCSLEFIRDELL